ncbi:hypothetical protein X946_5527 [Burkholderia sp. ABCPW 111]|nr:hypothetical protein X946_5527 [Burkholderia sp. ABCPW 111]
MRHSTVLLGTALRRFFASKRLSEKAWPHCLHPTFYLVWRHGVALRWHVCLRSPKLYLLPLVCLAH